MDMLTCDVCGTEIIDYEHDLYHFSGILNGKTCNHIHVCKQCFDNCNQDLYGINVEDGEIHRVIIKNQFESHDVCAAKDVFEPIDIEYILSDEELDALIKGFRQ